MHNHHYSTDVEKGDTVSIDLHPSTAERIATLEAKARRWDLVRTRAALMWSDEPAIDRNEAGEANDRLVDDWIKARNWPACEQETRQ